VAYRGAAPIESFSSIKPGDYLVHINYGIEGTKGSHTCGMRDRASLAYQMATGFTSPWTSAVESTQRWAPPALDRLGSKGRLKEEIEITRDGEERPPRRERSWASDTPWQMFESLPDDT
jgi:hypothetical protein